MRKKKPGVKTLPPEKPAAGVPPMAAKPGHQDIAAGAAAAAVCPCLCQGCAFVCSCQPHSTY